MAKRMRCSTAKCFSILVAAGRGDACNTLRAAIRQATLVRGPDGEIDAITWTSRGLMAPRERARIARTLGRLAADALAGIPEHVFGPDRGDREPRDIN